MSSPETPGAASKRPENAVSGAGSAGATALGPPSVLPGVAPHAAVNSATARRAWPRRPARLSSGTPHRGSVPPASRRGPGGPGCEPRVPASRCEKRALRARSQQEPSDTTGRRRTNPRCWPASVPLGPVAQCRARNVGGSNPAHPTGVDCALPTGVSLEGPTPEPRSESPIRFQRTHLRPSSWPSPERGSTLTRGARRRERRVETTLPGGSLSTRLLACSGHAGVPRRASHEGVLIHG